MYTIEELEILKSALEGDIIYQKKQLETIDDVRFEVWLEDTQKLHKKVVSQLTSLNLKL